MKWHSTSTGIYERKYTFGECPYATDISIQFKYTYIARTNIRIHVGSFIISKYIYKLL